MINRKVLENPKLVREMDLFNDGWDTLHWLMHYHMKDTDPNWKEAMAELLVALRSGDMPYPCIRGGIRQTSFKTEDGDTLVVRYSNRGDPYKEGVEFAILEDGEETSQVLFLEKQSAEKLRDFLGNLYPKRFIPTCKDCGSTDIETSGPDHMPFYCRKCNSDKIENKPLK